MDSSDSVTYVILVTSPNDVRHHIAGHGQANLDQLLSDLDTITKYPLVDPSGMLQLIQAVVVSLYVDHQKEVPNVYKEAMRKIVRRISADKLQGYLAPWWQ